MKIIKIFLIITFIITCSSLFARTHPYFVRSVGISPDGKYILAGRLDGKIILWDRENKKIVKVIEGQPGEINIDANLTPDSKYIVFQDKTYDLMFYNINEDKITKRIHLNYESNHIIFLDNMTKMVLGGTDGRIEVWDLVNNKIISTLKVPDVYEPDPAISGMMLSPDGNYFVTSVFGRLGGWDLVPEPNEDFKEVKKGIYLVKHRGTNLWDSKTLTKIKKLQGENICGRTWAVFSPDGKHILITSENGGLCRFDGSNGQKLMEYQSFSADGIGFVEENGEYFICIQTRQKPWLALYSINTEKVSQDINLTNEPVTGALTTLPSQNLIVTGDEDGSISVYRFNPDKLDIELEWHPKPVPAGIIKWISPLYLIDKTPEQISDLRKRYEEEQKKLIKEEQKE